MSKIIKKSKNPKIRIKRMVDELSKESGFEIGNCLMEDWILQMLKEKEKAIAALDPNKNYFIHPRMMTEVIEIAKKHLLTDNEVSAKSA